METNKNNNAAKREEGNKDSKEKAKETVAPTNGSQSSAKREENPTKDLKEKTADTKKPEEAPKKTEETNTTPAQDQKKEKVVDTTKKVEGVSK